MGRAMVPLALPSAYVIVGEGVPTVKNLFDLFFVKQLYGEGPNVNFFTKKWS